MNGKIVVITGASSGIGLETARQLAAKGAHMVLVCRDAERGRAARLLVAESASDAAPELILADLLSQASTEAAAHEIRRRYRKIDVLVNNAGSVFGQRELSPDRIEKTFALNHLAPFLLTELLLEPLVQSGEGRIVTVSSEIHSGSLDFDNLQGERRYNFLDAYYRSKLANILFTYELARRADPSVVTANVLSPGPTRTQFGDNLKGWPRLFPLVMKNIPFLFAAPRRGARTSVYLASSLEVTGTSGRFFMNNQPIDTKPISHDLDVSARLWEISERLTGRVFKPEEMGTRALLPRDRAYAE